MEFLEGETLADRLRSGRMALDTVLKTAIEIADALDTAHRAGIVHRDVKPGNIMLTRSGATLVDFGLAKGRAAMAADAPASALPTELPDLTVEGTILGTVQYMAPEQLEGREADARTDIFAIGAVLFEMIAGRRAFTGDTRANVMSAILRDSPRQQPPGSKSARRIACLTSASAAPAGMSRVMASASWSDVASKIARPVP